MYSGVVQNFKYFRVLWKIATFFHRIENLLQIEISVEQRASVKSYTTQLETGFYP
jgi:hypothetical protein